MKVLHLFREKNNGEIGGVENHIGYLTKQQRAQGEVTPSVVSIELSNQNSIVTKRIDGNLWYYVQIKSIGVFRSRIIKKIEGSKWGLVFTILERIHYNWYSKKILDLLKTLQPDMVHQHDYLASVVLSKKISREYPVVFTSHYGEFIFLEKRRLTRWIQKQLMKPFSHIIASSPQLLPKIENSTLIPNGFDHNRFFKISEEEKKKLRDQHNIDGKTVFLCARRWAPNKGIIYLAKAISLVPIELRKKAVFLFAGNNSSDYEGYKKQIHQQLSLCKHCEIRLLGNLTHDQLIEQIHIADVGVIPSVMEGMSLFSIELLATGTPILATNVGGLPEVINEGENGWLVPPKNEIELSKAISSIILQPESSKLFVDTNYYKENFSWQTIAKKTKTIYSKI